MVIFRVQHTTFTFKGHLHDAVQNSPEEQTCKKKKKKGLTEGRFMVSDPSSISG